jgi:very-short-patch-repair endonuclease
MVYLGMTVEPHHQFGAGKGIVENARNLRKRLTRAEMIMWSVLRKRQQNGMRFRRQHPVGYYIADFYCVDYKLVIEIDGGSHIGKEEYDERRSQFITDHGLTILRFTNEQVLNNLNEVLIKIKSYSLNKFPLGTHRK